MIYTDYNEYLKQQIVRAESKWGRKWDYDEIFKQLLHLSLDEIEPFMQTPTAICCMGCRAGTEVFEFKERYPSAQVYGVDITNKVESIRSHLAVKILLQDFNKLPFAWDNKFDLIFSNSLDHAYEPQKTIMEWWRVCQKDGHIFVELSTLPENNIEHSFTTANIDALFDEACFEKLVVWDTPARNIISCLVRVIKNEIA